MDRSRQSYPQGGGRTAGPRVARPISVLTNCFEITQLPKDSYYQYDVFIPEVKIPRKRHEIIHKLQNVVAPGVFNPRGLYDGKAILYVSHELRLPGGGTGEVTVSLRTDLNTTAGQPGVFKVRLTRTAGDPIRPADLKSLRAQNSGLSSRRLATSINLLQILIRQIESYDDTRTTRAFFVPSGSLKIGHGLELWKGFFHSVRPTIGKLLINVDTTTTAIYQSGPLIGLSLSFLGNNNNVRDLSTPDLSRLRGLERFLLNLRINTATTGRRTKTIRGLVANAGRYTFEKDGRATTISNYFRSVHNITLSYPDAIGVRLSGANAPFPVIMPVELCEVIAGQLYKKKLPAYLTADMVKFSTQRPNNKISTILSNPDSPVNKYASSGFIQESGTTIDTRALTVHGKLLVPPQLEFGNRTKVTPDNGSWNLRQQKLFEPKSLERWIIINFCTAFETQDLQGFVQALTRCSYDLGMTMSPPASCTNGSGNNVQRTLDKAIENLAKVKNTTPDKVMSSLQLVLVFFPAKGDEIRNTVKFWGDCVRGAATQCVREDKVKGANSQYWCNVLLKINARLGGFNCLAEIPILREFVHEKTPFMIMGADVGHPGPGVLKPSIASLVWSYDFYASKYMARTCLQSPHQEIISDLRSMVCTAICSYGDASKAAPRKIVFFRDGVSEGEFETVRSFEIKAIKDAIDDVWQKRREFLHNIPKPTLTFIVVGKRHHMSFFPAPSQSSSDVDRSGNIVAGFATNEGQLASTLFPDFYLQSHAAIQGTSRSGHYTILHDENFGGSFAKVQELAFGLCHVYAKATRSVSIPAPVYYADIVCSRATFHYQPDSKFTFGDDDSSADGAAFNLDEWKAAFRPIHATLKDKMYFL